MTDKWLKWSNRWTENRNNWQKWTAWWMDRRLNRRTKQRRNDLMEGWMDGWMGPLITLMSKMNKTKILTYNYCPIFSPHLWRPGTRMNFPDCVRTLVFIKGIRRLTRGQQSRENSFWSSINGVTKKSTSAFLQYNNVTLLKQKTAGHLPVFCFLKPLFNVQSCVLLHREWHHSSRSLHRCIGRQRRAAEVGATPTWSRSSPGWNVIFLLRGQTEWDKDWSLPVLSCPCSAHTASPCCYYLTLLLHKQSIDPRQSAHLASRESGDRLKSKSNQIWTLA